MASPLRPLQLLCERRSSIFSFVPEFLSSRKSFAASLPVHHAPRSHKDHLDTRYGLQVNFENGQITAVRAIPPVSDPATDLSKTESLTATTKSPTIDSLSMSSSPTESSNTNSSITDAQTTSVHDMGSSSPHPYSYRLFPDWQTSFLWYGISYPPAVADGYWQAEKEDISSRYPMLATYYFDWQELYESALENQRCHLGQRAEVFPDAHERAAWKVEGFLIACWLALGEDVGTVEYKPGAGGKAYLLGENVGTDEMLRMFLRDVDIELED